VIIFNKTVFLE